MNSDQRVIAALNRQPVDRVPTFEWLISQNVIDQMLPGADEASFIEAMDIDGIVVYADYRKEYLDEITYRDEWGVIKKKTDEEVDVPISGPVHNEEELAAYNLPDPGSAGRLNSLAAALKRFSGKRAVILHLNDVFSLPSRIMGMEDFLMAAMAEPELVEKIVARTVDFNIALASRAWDMGLRIVMTGDDFCYTTGPMVSPQCFREVFFPYYKKIMTAYRDIGFCVIKHCDGNVLPIIDMIMNAPIHCFDPMEPAAGMSLKYFKDKYGSRFCLKGNVDCGATLTFGSVDDVVRETREALEIGMPGYGYILSSSNSIHSKVKPENYQAMLDTLKRFGVYK